MFTPEKYSECIGTIVIQSKAEQASRSTTYPGYITVPEGAAGANAVLVQVYYNPTEVVSSGIDLDNLAGVPLVSIDEFNSYDGVDPNNVNQEWSTPGMKLLNFGNFLIETGKNISNAKIIPFNAAINVYIVLNYYK